MRVEEEIGVMCRKPRNAKDYQVATRSYVKNLEHIVPQRLPKQSMLAIPWFPSTGFQNRERALFCCFKPPSLWYFVMAALTNQ